MNFTLWTRPIPQILLGPFEVFEVVNQSVSDIVLILTILFEVFEVGMGLRVLNPKEIRSRRSSTLTGDRNKTENLDLLHL